MNLSHNTQRLRDRCDIVFRQCVSLNTELYKLVPLARKMHLLSLNAVSSAARAGSDGDAFRVLTQDIQLLGDDVSDCIEHTQKIIGEIVSLASVLVRLFSSYVDFTDLVSRIEGEDTVTSPDFFSVCADKSYQEIKDLSLTLRRAINELNTQLSPLAVLANKGEYLAVCSFVEAATAGVYGESFDAVAKMLRELVQELSKQSSSQQILLRDLAEGVEVLHLM